MPKCDHVAFRVADLERAIAFYERVLPGRTIARKQTNDRWRTAIAWVEPEGQPGFAFVLIQATRVRWLLRLFHAVVPRVMRGYEHAGLACASREEVDERARAAVEAGARLLFPPTFVDERTGYVAEAVDPDGNPIEWTHGQTFG
ncbi:MAG: VOC family protein [Planctomycetota bacterium JB042]